jgi:hypothetical protein
MLVRNYSCLSTDSTVLHTRRLKLFITTTMRISKFFSLRLMYAILFSDSSFHSSHKSIESSAVRKVLCVILVLKAPQVRFKPTQRRRTYAIKLFTHTLTHGAEVFLRSCQLRSHSRNNPSFYGTRRFTTVFTRALHRSQT